MGPDDQGDGSAGRLIPAKRICATHWPLPRNDAGKVDGQCLVNLLRPAILPSKE